jgi:Flagellar hook-length control protein FliK
MPTAIQSNDTQALTAPQSASALPYDPLDSAIQTILNAQSISLTGLRFKAPIAENTALAPLTIQRRSQPLPLTDNNARSLNPEMSALTHAVNIITTTDAAPSLNESQPPAITPDIINQLIIQPQPIITQAQTPSVSPEPYDAHIRQWQEHITTPPQHIITADHKDVIPADLSAPTELEAPRINADVSNAALQSNPAAINNAALPAQPFYKEDVIAADQIQSINSTSADSAKELRASLAPPQNPIQTTQPPQHEAHIRQWQQFHAASPDKRSQTNDAAQTIPAQLDMTSIAVATYATAENINTPSAAQPAPQDEATPLLNLAPPAQQMHNTSDISVPINTAAPALLAQAIISSPIASAPPDVAIPKDENITIQEIATISPPQQNISSPRTNLENKAIVHASYDDATQIITSIPTQNARISLPMTSQDNAAAIPHTDNTDDISITPTMPHKKQQNNRDDKPVISGNTEIQTDHSSINAEAALHIMPMPRHDQNGMIPNTAGDMRATDQRYDDHALSWPHNTPLRSTLITPMLEAPASTPSPMPNASTLAPINQRVDQAHVGASINIQEDTSSSDQSPSDNSQTQAQNFTPPQTPQADGSASNNNTMTFDKMIAHTHITNSSAHQTIPAQNNSYIANANEANVSASPQTIANILPSGISTAITSQPAQQSFVSQAQQQTSAPQYNPIDLFDPKSGYVKQIINALRDGKSELRLSLYPAQLGQVVIAMSLEGQHLNVDLKTTSQHATDALTLGEDSLKEALTREGFILDSFTISDRLNDNKRRPPQHKAQARNTTPPQTSDVKFSIDMIA